jgi:hypothetical protein
MFQDTGDVIRSAFDILADPDLSLSSQLEILRLLEAESRRRDELLASQLELQAAETEYLKRKTEALKSGKGLITIQASGVYPELELVLKRIVELAQVQGNAEGLEYLLGV